MSIIAMYRTVAAMKKSVGQPFRYIDTTGRRLVFEDWAGDAFEVVSPDGTPYEPVWRCSIKLDRFGTLVSVVDYDELLQEQARRLTTRRGRLPRQIFDVANIELTYEPFDITVTNVDNFTQTVNHEWAPIEILEVI